MIKALVTAEGTARKAWPDLDFVAEVGDDISRLAIQRFSPEVIWRNL